MFSHSGYVFVFCFLTCWLLIRPDPMHATRLTKKKNFLKNIRFLSPLPQPQPKFLWIPVWIRTCFFIPFFLFCNFDLPDPKLPVLIGNDHVYLFGAVVFAFTNGYFSSLGMMYAPRYKISRYQSCSSTHANLSVRVVRSHASPIGIVQFGCVR
ncbi:unnamed protein product [Echinostoma caproni]|uniref:Secreted protein n=1 Tax=Echinostoma caproni TaxID=27848 RepID=A0A183AQR1_9TREM|nr:unnamed protein product [Echinostoma caproni]